MCCYRSYRVLWPMQLLLWILPWKWLPSLLLGSPSLWRVLVWGSYIWRKGYAANSRVRMYHRFRWILHSSCFPYAEYQLWRNNIPYAEWLVDEMGYDEFNETRLMPSLILEVCFLLLFTSLPLFFHFCTWQYSNVMLMLGWSCCWRPCWPPSSTLVSLCGPDGFAHECPVGHNTNVMGYPFPKGTQVVSSLSSLSYLFFFHIL